MPWYDKQVAEMNERRARIDAIRQRTDDSDLSWLMAEYDKLEAYCNATCEAFEWSCMEHQDEIDKLAAQTARTQ